MLKRTKAVLLVEAKTWVHASFLAIDSRSSNLYWGNGSPQRLRIVFVMFCMIVQLKQTYVGGRK